MIARARLALPMLAALSLCACPRPRPATTAASTPTTSPAAAEDIRPMCAEEIRRELSCQDDFVPMIVDVRSKLDLPKGMAERTRTPAGRDEVIAEARVLFAKDYAVDKIPAVCEQRQAQVAGIPPEVVEQLKVMSAACAAEKDCPGFTRCMAPILEKMLAMGAHGT